MLPGFPYTGHLLIFKLNLTFRANIGFDWFPPMGSMAKSKCHISQIVNAFKPIQENEMAVSHYCLTRSNT